MRLRPEDSITYTFVKVNCVLARDNICDGAAAASFACGGLVGFRLARHGCDSSSVRQGDIEVNLGED